MDELNRDQWPGSAKRQSVSLTRERFVAQVKTLAQDVEELLKATADQTGEKIASARVRAEESLRKTKASVAEASKEVAERTRAAVATTDQYVHENPWQVLAVAVGIAFALGYLSRRR